MKIPILMYHSISNDKSNLSVSIENFEKQIGFMRQLNFKAIHFDDIDDANHNNLIITFDDGYKDNLINAMPILKKFNFKATCFVVSNLIGKSNNWDINTKNYIYKELLSSSDINEWLNNDMKIGSHTKNHSNLSKLTTDEIKTEIINSKLNIENLICKKINAFSYPYGRLNKNISEIVKNNYKFSVTTIRSRFDKSIHKLNFMPRIHMTDSFSKFKIYLKLKTIYEDIKYNEKQLYM